MWVSAGFSPIEKKAASKKNGRARARVHIAYTTFPQAAKPPASSPGLLQLHAFVREKRVATPLQESNRRKKEEKFTSDAVDK
jgi:hypothetical protein